MDYKTDIKAYNEKPRTPRSLHVNVTNSAKKATYEMAVSTLPFTPRSCFTAALGAS